MVDDAAASRYELRIDGTVVGSAEYTLQPGSIVVTHTEVDPDVGGRGLGTRLAAAVVADAQARNLHLVPRCPFIARYLATRGTPSDP